MAHKRKLKDKRKCLRCGKCCYYVTKDSVWKKCPYMVTGKNARTTCTRYHKRIGTRLPNGQFCNYRSEYRFNIKGCPYNKVGLPNHPIFK